MKSKERIVWEKLYDIYAPVIYGTILEFTEDGSIAADIFCEVFVHLKRENFFQNFEPPHQLPLVKCTRYITYKKMQEIRMPPGKYVIY